MKDKAREAEGKIHSLNITIKKERKEKELVETQLRDVMSEKMVAEETIQGLQLKVIQLEITLSKKHCKVPSEQAVTAGHKSGKDAIKKIKVDLNKPTCEIVEIVQPTTPPLIQGNTSGTLTSGQF